MKIVRMFFPLIILTALIGCSQNMSDFEGIKKINDTNLYIKTLGSGEPLIIIHGGPGLSHDYFLPHLGKLSKEYRLIFYDQRGAGKSSKNQSPETINLKTFAEDIEAIRNEFSLGRIHLFSHSWGAKIASEYAIRYPQNVSSLIYCSPVHLANDFENEVNNMQMSAMDSSFLSKRERLMSSLEFKNGNVEAYENLFILSFSLLFKKKEKVDLLSLNLPTDFIKSQELLQGFSVDNRRNLLAELENIPINALILRGKYDLSVYEADSALAEITGANLIELESGHFPFIESYRSFEKAIMSFMEEIQTSN
ncbi:hypothetical protein BFP97_06110 [Roseivirga sp. 4D4]|uniref:alpha/beta fold hydrolase n=1 Tax=Roseivirga sp. 4D4 TaxID=1889784 RepID=UPI00085341CB|nr:alpha/beta fold hydrolase [Roseivirga sp. 4D4]OEK01106.1 hypothetical protein BFP97_06110 [Roseivirga sp. 4D4]